VITQLNTGESKEDRSLIERLLSTFNSILSLFKFYFIDSKVSPANQIFMEETHVIQKILREIPRRGINGVQVDIIITTSQYLLKATSRKCFADLNDTPREELLDQLKEGACPA
jgi:hypothetical protein